MPRRRLTRRDVRADLRKLLSISLYVRGHLPACGLAIVGSRTPPCLAAEFAFALASRIGEPVIAGLAPGVDVAAHRGALSAGLPTVAFVPYGFGATDPPQHADLEEAIVRAGGAIATILPPGTVASAQSRIDRDRLQAEYARAVVLVCSEIDGGAMYTMRFAQAMGRSRFVVVPPELPAEQAPWAGNHRCIEEGATPIPLDAAGALAVILA